MLDTKDVNFDWKNPETLSSNRSLMSLIAAKAAKRQGEDLFQRYHDKLLISRNSQIKRIRLNDKPTLIRLANECDLDLNQFEVDLNSEQIIDEVRIEYIVSKLRKKSELKSISPELIEKIWRLMINNFIEFEKENFDKIHKKLY